MNMNQSILDKREGGFMCVCFKINKNGWVAWEVGTGEKKSGRKNKQKRKSSVVPKTE
jgi:hypothetical protein